MIVTAILAILAHFNILSFSWYVPLIEGAVYIIIGIINTVRSTADTDPDTRAPLGTIAIGAGWGGFAAYKLWCVLSLNGLWILLSEVVAAIALLLPGGISLMNWLLSHFGLAVISPAFWIIGFVLDALMLLFEIFSIIELSKD